MTKWADAEQIMLHDPQGRGVAALYRATAPLGEGLQRAAESLLASSGEIWIATGFPVPTADGWVGETDGPPGALVLAHVLHRIGFAVRLLTDEVAAPLLQLGVQHWKLPLPVEVCPFESGGPDSLARQTNQSGTFERTDAWIDSLDMTKLAAVIAIERPGPSHTAASLGTANADALEKFQRIVPVEAWDVCHNMRGQSINAQAGKLHRLFDRLATEPSGVVTLGIGDGGNEIGMGYYRWSELAVAIGHGPGTQTACRIATDHLLVGGASNWAGYALAAMLARSCGQPEIFAERTTADLAELIRLLVEEGGAVDGLVRQRSVTVDGLPLEHELAIFDSLLQLVLRKE